MSKKQVKQKAKQTFIDSLGKKEGQEKFFDFPVSRFILKYKKSSVLFLSRPGGGRTDSFFTSDSKLYYTPEELRALQRGEKIIRLTKRLDSLAERVFAKNNANSAVHPSLIFAGWQKKYLDYREQLEILMRDSARGMAVARMWNASIVASVLIGMLLMTMIYRNLGQGVSAMAEETKVAQLAEEARVIGAETEKDPIFEIDTATITQLFREYDSEDDQEFQRQKFAEEIRQIVEGTPIEKMIPEIAKQDRIVAAFLVAIAKKESGWGVHVPVYQGQDCYNYWGWRGKNPVGSGGHTCFDSPKDAVETVSKRIAFLVSSKKLDTPQKMIVWKCGDCGWDNSAAMQSWINTVDMYFRKLNKNKDEVDKS
ncbi:MAG: hypothetical protein CO141_02370 [Candidatus Moranbacteria bacterium CG_4_9_14_3_um_filter_42_9]|nr:MAG: hypothetical protein CO141_02370 [Candidatus Moranbacteria bacterium CG_4_9_14_3_um_filter_42_9]